MKIVNLLTFIYLLLLAVMPSKAEVGLFEKAQIQHSKTIHSELQSQQKVDAVDNEIQALQEKIKANQRKMETLERYNQRMQKLIADQNQELTHLENETKRVTHLDREMLPLVEDMLEQLEIFIANDLPFLHKERRQRLATLKEMLNHADVSIAEKFRRLLEAFQIENEYGRTLEVYKGPLPETERVVEFLRIGRNMLFYKSQNNTEIARWNHKLKTWDHIDKKYHREIKKAYLIAANQRAPELLLLPTLKVENLEAEK